MIVHTFSIQEHGVSTRGDHRGYDLFIGQIRGSVVGCGVLRADREKERGRETERDRETERESL